MARTALQPERRREMLVETALALFLEHGYAVTSVADIVRRAGVAQGTFYYHFESKEAVATAAVEALATPLLAAVSRATGDEQVDPAGRVMAFLDTLLAAMQSHADTIARLVTPANDVLHTRFGTAIRSQLGPLFGRLVAAGKERGCFAVDDPAATAEMLLATLPHVTAAHAAGADDPHVARLRAATRSLFRNSLASDEQP